MRLIYLSQSFYSHYPNSKYPEILKKNSRPYYYVSIMVEGHHFAIPLRHHILHPFAFITVGDAGLDFTKAVLIDDPSDVSPGVPWINSKEWGILKTNENRIFYEFRKYVRQYKRAAANPQNPRSQRILRYSSLQYFDLT